MNIAFLEAPTILTCGVLDCHKTAKGYSWTLLESKTPKLDGKEILRPLFLCQGHINWFSEVVKDITCVQLWRLVEKETQSKGGETNVSTD